MSTQPTAAPAASPPCRANSSRGQPDYVRFIMYLAGPDISGTSSGFLGCLKTLRPSCNCNEQFSRVRVNGRNIPHGLTRLVLRKRHHKLHARGRMCLLTDSAKAVSLQRSPAQLAARVPDRHASQRRDSHSTSSSSRQPAGTLWLFGVGCIALRFEPADSPLDMLHLLIGNEQSDQQWRPSLMPSTIRGPS